MSAIIPFSKNQGSHCRRMGEESNYPGRWIGLHALPVKEQFLLSEEL